VTVDKAIEELQKLAGEFSVAGHDEAARMTHTRIGELQQAKEQAAADWFKQRG
jgi:hypothetical protein